MSIGRESFTVCDYLTTGPTVDPRFCIGIAGFAAVLVVIAGDTGHAKTACDRACLTGFVDTYFNALAANNPGAVPLAPNAKITTNGRLTKLDQAFWDSAERTVYRYTSRPRFRQPGRSPRSK